VGEPDARTVVVIASRFERLKGHAALLRALAGVSGEWSLWIVGGAQRAAEREYLSELDSLSQSLRIAERVRMFGERADVPRILQAADVLCQPNTAPEAFGLVFVEALLARLPVVTTAVGGALEIVTPECGVLVPGDDARALTRALQRLIDDPALRRGLGTAGPARARALCDPERQLAHLHELLQPVAAGVRR